MPVGVTFQVLKCVRVYAALSFLFFAFFSCCQAGKAMEDTYAKSVEEVLEHFDVKPEVGLSSSQIEDQRRINGWNGEFWRSRTDVPDSVVFM